MPEAECIDCGRWSEALLPARFPHICPACLFPPTQPEEGNGEPTDEVRAEFTHQTLYERIHELRSNGTFHGPGERFTNGRLPEKYDERSPGDRRWN